MWPSGDKNQCLNTPCQGTPTKTEWVVSVSLGEEKKEEVNVDKVSVALLFGDIHRSQSFSRASLIEKILVGFGGLGP